MSPVAALIVVAALILLAVGAGLLWKRANTRVHAPTHRDLRADLRAWGVSPAAAVTLIQFSTPSCSYCPGVRRVLDRVSADRTDVAVVQWDLGVDDRPASVLGIRRTPTVIAVDRGLHVRGRVSGPASLRTITELVEAARRPRTGQPS